MAFTENYAILNDFPLFWDPKLLRADVHLPGFHRDMPSRFAVIPRRGGTDEIRWFEADPTFVLHFTNAYEDGDEIVLDGFFEGDPHPVDIAHRRQVPEGVPVPRARRVADPPAPLAVQPRHRGRRAKSALSDSITEFGMINGGYAGGKYRYTYAATGKPGWFLFDGLVKHDLQTGTEERFAFERRRLRQRDGDGAARRQHGEDDGYLVTLTTDMNADASYCLVFDAARVADGPVCKLALPERISSGTHSTWAPGSELRRWRDSRLRGRRDRPVGGRSRGPTPSPACWGCSATSGRCWSSSRRCWARRGTANSRRDCRSRTRC